MMPNNGFKDIPMEECDGEYDLGIYVTKVWRNWIEDYDHENGNYYCQCMFCKNMFKGHKRRVVCKECAGGNNGK
jgi:hypothetical protein